TPTDIDSYKQETTARAKNDPQTLIDFMSGATPLTVDNVKAAYAHGKLSDAGYVDWTGEALKAQGDPQKLAQVKMDHQQITDILTLNNLPGLARPDSVAAGD